MPVRNKQVKPKTSLGKVRVKKSPGRSKPTEPPVRGRTKDARGAPPASVLSGGQQRGGTHTGKPGHTGKRGKRLQLRPSKLHGKPSRPMVPVFDSNRKPLMPTKASRAESWIKSKKATPFWSKGVFCVRLNKKPSARNVQPIAVGIDPGSKREGFTVKSRSHTYLNVLTNAVTWVKMGIKHRRQARRVRRYRNCPCRKNKENRKRGGIPPSTKARWGAKLRIVDWLIKVFPISGFEVEDVRAKTKGKRRWDVNFSPLEVGKQWFYSELKTRGILVLKRGYETKALRDALGLKKSKSKLADKFECHNVDSWVLANDMVGGHSKPDNTTLVKLVPMQFHRRQLHVFQPSEGGERRPYGGTRSLGFKRGSLVRHPKYGLCYVGGSAAGKISLHDFKTFKRLTTRAEASDLEFLAYCSWRREGVCANSSHD